ncbi:TPA: hypothetical protein I9Y37_001851 [Citrobacter freundii]|nr:hypothetical protein [Citrobacter freundii]HAT3963829.1 hypothetical protein [Citrobacter freundii]
MQKIPRAIGKASGTAVADTDSSGTMSVEGGGLSVFAGVITSRRGKPFTVLSLNKATFRDILGTAFHPNEQPKHFEPIRHLNQALNGGPGYVVRVVPSDMEIPFVKFSTPGYSNIPGSQPDVDPVKSTFTAFPGNATADGKSSITLSFTAKDKDGNLLKGLNFVGFETTGVAVTIGKTTESNGVYTANLTGVVPGRVIVRPTVARKAVGNLSRQITLDQMPNQVATLDPDACTFWLSNSRVYADGKSFITMFLQLKDTDGNPLSIQESRVNFVNLGAITVTITSPVESQSTPGLYTAQLSGKQVGSLTVVPTIDGGMIGGIRGSLVYLDKSPTSSSDNKVDSNQSTFSASAKKITANGTDKVTLTFTARNSAGALMPGLQEKFGIAIYNLTGVSKTDFVESSLGVYTTVITLARSSVGDRAEIHALYNGVTVEDLIVMLDVDRIKEELPVVDDSRSTLDASTNTAWATGGVGAGSRVTLTLTLIDTNNQPMPHRAVLFNVAGAANLGSIAENQPGVYTVDVFSYNENNVNVVPMLDGLPVGNLSADIAFKTKPVVIAPLDEVRSAKTLSVAPSSIAADGSKSSIVSIQLSDTNGAPVINREGDLGFAVNLPGLDITAWAESPSAPGFYMATITSTKVGSYSISATLNGKPLSNVTRTLEVDAVEIKISNTYTKFDIAPVTINDDGSQTATLTLTLKNTSNKAISGVADRVSFEANDLTYVSITSAKETAAGTGVYTAIITGKQIKGSVVIKPQFDGAYIGTKSVNLELIDPPSVQPPLNVDLTGSQFVIDKAQIRSDKSTDQKNKQGFATVTFNAKDVNGSPIIPALLPHLTFIGSGASGYAISPLASDGAGNYTATVTPAQADSHGTLTIKAMYDGKPVKSNGVALEVTVVMVGAIDANKSELKASTTSAKADGKAAIALTFTAKDVNGTLVDGAAVAFNFAGGITPATSAVNPAPNNGVYAVNAISTEIGSATVSVSVDGVDFATPTVQIAFTSPIEDSKSLLDATPSSVVGDGQAIATVKVTLKDSAGTGVTGLAGGLMLHATDDSGAQVDLSAITFTEVGNGIYSAPVSMAVTTDTTLTISVALFGTVLTKTDTVLFTVPVPPVGAPDPAHTDFTTDLASGSTVVPDDATLVNITINLRDANNQPITNAGATLALVPSVTPKSTTTLSSLVEDAQAPGTYKATCKASKPDAFDLTMTVGGNPFNKPAVHIAFAAAVLVPNVGHSLLDSDKKDTTARPQAIPADGTTAATVTLTLKDVNDTPVSGRTVVFVPANNHDTTTIGNVTENPLGTYSADITATGADKFDVSVTVDGAAFAAPAISFHFVSVPDVANSTFAAAPAQIPANGSDTSTLTLTLKSYSGEPIKGKTVVFASTGMASTTTLSAVTETVPNSSGIYTATVKGTAAETLSFKVSVDGNDFAIAPAGVEITALSAVAADSTLTRAPATGDVNTGTAVPLVLTLKNGSTPITGRSVTFEKTGSKATTVITQPTEGNPANGVYTGSVIASAADSVDISVKVDGVALTGSTVTKHIDFVVPAPVTPDAAPASTLTRDSTGDVNAGAVIHLTVVLKDSGGAAIGGQASKLKLYDNKGKSVVTGVTFAEDSTTSGTYTGDYTVDAHATAETLEFDLQFNGKVVNITNKLSITVN